MAIDLRRTTTDRKALLVQVDLKRRRSAARHQQGRRYENKAQLPGVAQTKDCAWSRRLAPVQDR